METNVHYIKIGLIVLFLTSSLIAVSIWLSVGFDQKKYNTYVVYMNEPVSGLNEQSIVKYNGVQVGKVREIHLSQGNPQEVNLLLDIEEGTPITTSTYATLISQGITGVTYVGLAASSPDLTPLEKMPNAPFPVIPSKASLFNQLDGLLKHVSENINEVSLRLKILIDDENIKNIKKTLNNLSLFTETIAQHNQDISHTLENLNLLSHNMTNASTTLPEVVHELKKSISQLTKEISLAGTNVSETMQTGKTAINKISEQTLPAAVVLLRKLNHIANNLEKITGQMRQNPSVLIRGTTQPLPGPGE